MARYFLGVDVGSSKCHALVVDESGQALGLGKWGPGNHEVVGYGGLIEALNAITTQALAQAGLRKEQIAGAGFGIAGYDWPSELAPTLDAIATLGLSAPVEAVNDTIVGLVAGARDGWGVGLVAGTGTNCWGWDANHRVGRVTGNGGSFGEYAGGGELAHRAVIAVAYEWSRRGPATQLTPALLGLVGAKDSLDFLEGLTLERYHIPAQAAPLVFQIAEAGDSVARDIIIAMGRELGDIANGVIRQIELEDAEFDLVLIGSLYNGGPLLTEPLRQTVHSLAPGARLVRLQAPPVVGGALIGMQQVGITPAAVRERLLASAAQIMQK